MHKEQIGHIASHYARKIHDLLEEELGASMPGVSTVVTQPINSMIIVVMWEMCGACVKVAVPEQADEQLVLKYLQCAAEKMVQKVKEKVGMTPYQTKKKQQEQLEFGGSKYLLQKQEKEKGGVWWNSNMLDVFDVPFKPFKLFTAGQGEYLKQAMAQMPEKYMGISTLSKQPDPFYDLMKEGLSSYWDNAIHKPLVMKPSHYPQPITAPQPVVNRNPTFYDLVCSWTKDALEAAIVLETKRLCEFEQHVAEGADESYVVEIFSRLKDLRNARDMKKNGRE